MEAELTPLVPAPEEPESPPWRTILRQAVRDPAELTEMLRLPAEVGLRAVAAAGGFPLLVPRPFISRMRPGDPEDPLLLQVLPRREELRQAQGFSADPLEEQGCLAAPGVLRKYQGRALLLCTPACAIHCRYCFRRNFPPSSMASGRKMLEKAVSFLENSPDVSEVILSGGDPLTLPDELLSWLSGRLDQIGHLKRLRIHTRMPAVVPERVDGGLLDWLSKGRLGKIMVLHINHPRELDRTVEGALKALSDSPVRLYNQSVLLKGVNDEAEVLINLQESLYIFGVLPYYLHQVDRVGGTAHFEVTDGEAVNLLDEVRGALPGYMTPRLVREKPGSRYKIAVG